MTACPRLLYVITEDWYFWSHRLGLAQAARDAGFAVSIATRVQEHGERIRQEGFQLLPISLLRRSRNPIREIQSIIELVRLYRRYRPDIVHHVGLKPILYGSVAARLTGCSSVLNAFAGLGYTYTEGKERSTALRRMVSMALRGAVKGSRSLALFQNRDDQECLIKTRVVDRDRTRVVPGSGVNVEMFHPQAKEAGRIVVVLASRMLWDKGIGEFVEAARILKRAGVEATFALVGRCDDENPAAILPVQLRQWEQEGAIEWWGHREEMQEVFNEATIVALPSYREGLPKVLLEAAASGLPIVATDAPGCREIVRHGDNGFLVPVREVQALADALRTLIQNKALCMRMGRRGREIVLEEFSQEKISAEIVAIYREFMR